MNVPYVKKFENNELLNPIEKFYNSRENDSQNRKERRTKPGRFKGNGKNFSLSVTKMGKYARISKLIVRPVYEETTNGKIKFQKAQTVQNNHVTRKVVNYYLLR